MTSHRFVTLSKLTQRFCSIREHLGEPGLDIALCVTPCNMVLNISLIDSAVRENGRHTYSFGQLIETGAPVMFSSDCRLCNPAPPPAIPSRDILSSPESAILEISIDMAILNDRVVRRIF